jgi:hypothetical protein
MMSAIALDCRGLRAYNGGLGTERHASIASDFDDSPQRSLLSPCTNPTSSSRWFVFSTAHPREGVMPIT